LKEVEETEGMLKTQTQQGVLVVQPSEKRLDASRAPRFKNEMTEFIAQGHRDIVIDFSSVDFVDSSGLGAIVSCLKQMGPQGNLAISGAGGAVRRLFSLTRMDRVFSLHETVDQAVDSLNR
jgi:anti-sigma B factor antagonist